MSTSLFMEPHLEALVREILATHLPDREVWAFGSRVTGTAKRYSDLDLVIVDETPLPDTLLMTVRESFEESDLPFQVDLLEWASLSEAFRGIIQQRYLVLQKRTDAPLIDTNGRERPS
jgi:predicted nucleotidyltransferase